MRNSTAETKQGNPHYGIFCPYCQRRFETSDELTLHIVTRHTQVGIRRGPASTGSSSK